MDDELKARVDKIIVEHLGVEPAKIVPAATLDDDLGADSLDCVELTMAMEEEFGIEIPDDDALGMEKTVGDWHELVAKKVAAHA